MSEATALTRLQTELDTNNWHWNLVGAGTRSDDKQRTIEQFDEWMAEERLPRTQKFAAREIARKFKNRVTYVAATQTWHIWDGRIHMPCEEKSDNLAMKMVDIYWDEMRDALLFIKSVYETRRDAVKASGVDKADEKAKQIMKDYRTIFGEHIKFRDNLTASRYTKDVIAFLKVELGVPADHYENDRKWFVVGNGYYDMDEVRETRKFVLKDHDPANPVWRYFYANEVIGAPYDELQRFLDNSIADASQAHFYGKAIASALMGAPYKTKTIVDAYGETDAGKSMINAIIDKLGHEFYYEASANAITAGGRDHDRYRDGMRQARIITFLEVKAKLDKVFILKYTGGDVIETDRKYRNSLQWRSQGMMFLMSNEGMNIGSQEAAVADRIARVNFPHQFIEGHHDERYRKDPELADKIVAQASGFLEWMKKCYLEHLAEDLDGQVTRSESMEMLKLEMQDDGNSVSIFWDRYVPNAFPPNAAAAKNQWVAFTVFYAAYKLWCQQNAFDQMDESDVKAWLKKNNYTERTNKLCLKERVENKDRTRAF